MSVKMTILYDNRCSDCELQEGWGFSALIEHEDAKILFDIGGDPASFFSNADKLKLPYQDITHLMFSHKHWDHIAGFKEVIEKLNQNVVLCVPKTFPRSLIKQGSSYFNTAKVVKSFEQIAPNAFSLVLRCGFWLYEQALVLRTSEGLGIITGCAHPGIIRIIQETQKHLKGEIAFVMGGFHQLFAPAEKSAHIVKQFEDLKVKKVAPCHCSGDHLIRQFQNVYKDHFFKVGTGSIFHI